MSTPALIADLRQRDIRLSIRAGKLAVDAPKGALTPEVLASLTARKAEILAALSTAPAGCAWREDEQGRLIFSDGCIYAPTDTGGYVLVKHPTKRILRPGTLEVSP